MQDHDFQFVYLGNNLAIDFVNTEIASRGSLHELLQNGDDLVRWAHEAGFRLKGRLSVSDFSAALELRGALKEAFSARIENLPARRKALVIINWHLANHATHMTLQITGNSNGYALVPDKDATDITVLLANLAFEGAKLLSSPGAEHIRHCGNPDCVLIFLDTSRSQKRRWCSMDTCGNRAKVAKHYRSHLVQ